MAPNIVPYYMQTVSISILKQKLASIIAKTEAGAEVLITRHNRPVARLTRPGTEHVHRGSHFGEGSLRPAMPRGTSGRYLKFLQEDRGGRGD